MPADKYRAKLEKDRDEWERAYRVVNEERSAAHKILNGSNCHELLQAAQVRMSELERLEAELDYYKRTLANLAEGESERADEDQADPPQGYSTWLEYYQTQAQRREPDERMQALIDENEELRVKISRQRRELKHVNRCIREQKLELEVLRGRNRQQEKTLRYELSARPSQLVTSEEAERIGREVREDFQAAVRQTEEMGRRLDEIAEREVRGKR